MAAIVLAYPDLDFFQALYISNKICTPLVL